MTAAPPARPPLSTLLDEIKFGHSIFALPFAGLALFLAAGGWPSWLHATLILVCMVAARTYAMTANRLIDRRLDAANPRTAGRALASGRLSVRFAVVALAVSAGVFVAGCAGFWLTPAGSNPWPLVFSVPTLVYLTVYSFLKRFTALCHLYLGAAIAFAPVATWIAISPATVGWPALVLMAAVATWIAGFDIIYALQDREHDQAAGLHSIPARLGAAPALAVSRILHVATVVLLVTLGVLASRGTLYWIGVGSVTALLAYEQSLVKPHDLSRVNLAFFTINGVVSLVMGVLGIADVLLHG